MTGSGMSQA